MSRPLLNAMIGRQGAVIPLAALRTRVGGDARLKKLLSALTITEKSLPGRPRGVASVTRRAYSLSRDALTIPCIKALPLLRAKMIDAMLAEPPSEAKLGTSTKIGTNASLPLPRELAAACLVQEEPFYPYQEAAIEYLCGTTAKGPGPLSPESVAAHTGVAYLEMQTGLGKSRVGAGVIARRREPALIVVPTSALAEQWLDEFQIVYPELTVAVYHNPPKNSRRVPPGPRTHDVVIIIINTFRDKTPEFMEGFGTVILDEAHEYCSVQNSRALWLAQTRAVLGLSATPSERPDGLDRYVHLHLGPVVYSKDIPNFDIGSVSFRGEVRLVEYTGHPDHCETATTPAGTMSAILTIGNINRDEARTRLIAAEIDRLAHLHETESPDELRRLGLGPRPEAAATPKHPAGEIRQHGVFVFAEHREYLLDLRKALLERVDASEILAPELEEKKTAKAGAARQPVTVLRGGVSKQAVPDARRAGAHIVLTTYGYSRRGISLPDMTALVRASPRRNGSTQINGRILRRGSDESILRQIVDIVDVTTGLRSQVSDRRKAYKAKGYPITKVHASWEDYPASEPAALPPPAEPAPAPTLTHMGNAALLAMALGETDDYFDVDDLLNE